MRLGEVMAKKGKPTQRELQIQEKEQFLDDVEERFDGLVYKWFLGSGELVLPGDALLASTKVAGKIRAIVEEFRYAQRMVRDGGPLTAKRREIMLDCIYKMEHVVAGMSCVHPLLAHSDRFFVLSSWLPKIFWVGVGCGAVGYAFDSSVANISAGLAGALWSVIFMAKRKYKREAIAMASTVVSRI